MKFKILWFVAIFAIFAIFAVFGLATASAGSTETFNLDASKKTAYYLAIKGGVSLGSYETGVNRAILKYLEKKDNAALVAFSGASAGSLNSVLSAIDICLPDKRVENQAGVIIADNIDNNFMRTAWDLGINDLVPERKNENSYKKLYKFDRKKQAAKDIGLFSREAFNSKKVLIRQLLTREGVEGCRLTITMSLTKFRPHKFEVDEIGAIIQLQRFVVPIEVLVDPVDGKIKFRNYDLGPKGLEGSAIPSQYLKLVAGGSGFIDFEEIWTLAMASSAFPVAFHPVELSYCFPYQLNGEACTKGRASTELFSDGGLFDNSPIGVAWELALPDIDKFAHTKLIYINPDSYRSNEAETKMVDSRSNIGIAEYSNYFSDSFLTAHESEYKSSLQKILDSNVNSSSRIYYMTNRYHHLLADLHAHFGAFYASEYRMHDYLVGVYDGANLTAQLDCDDKFLISGERKFSRFGSEYRECIRENVLVWVRQLKLTEASGPSIAFIQYLYDSEYNKSLNTEVRLDNTGNASIALSQSFGTINKSTGASIQYAEYLDRLRVYGSDLTLKKDSDLYQIIHNGKTFTSRKISKMYENIIQMQDLSAACEFCPGSEINQALGTSFKIAETMVDSFLSHHESNIWPKPINGVFGISYGFNATQQNQVWSVDYRPVIDLLAQHSFSVDLGVSYHDFGNELSNDDYASVSIGLAGHTNNLLLPTWGFGYQYEGRGAKVYKDTLQSVYLKVGFLNELFTLKYLKRLEDVVDHPIDTRADNTLLLSTDLSLVCQMAFPGWCR